MHLFDISNQAFPTVGGGHTLVTSDSPVCTLYATISSHAQCERSMRPKLTKTLVLGFKAHSYETTCTEPCRSSIHNIHKNPVQRCEGAKKKNLDMEHNVTESMTSDVKTKLNKA